ncbi:MAG: phosphocarrier protein HPr [Bacillus sp. (in: firmicutes)]|jgi:phosphocarrier protein HPr
MTEKVFTITDEAGMHARPSSLLVKAVTPFKSEVFIEYKDKRVNLKSIMGVMSLGIPYGASVNVIANGEDEEQVIDAVNTVIKEVGLAK